MQWNQQSRQADEAVAAIDSELDSMGCIPEEDQNQWASKKAEWEAEREQQSSAQRELSSCKESANQEKAAVQTEATSTQQKHERLVARATKLQEQHQRLQSANAQGLNEKERREAELAVKAHDRRQVEERWHMQIADLEKAVESNRQDIQGALQQTQYLATAYNDQQMMNAAIDPPAEAPGHPSTRPVFSFPPLGHAEQGNTRSKSVSHRHDFRPRSASLLSGDNGALNDFDDQDPAPPMPPTQSVGKPRGRQESGSAGGSVGIRLSPANKSGSPVWN